MMWAASGPSIQGLVMDSGQKSQSNRRDGAWTTAPKGGQLLSIHGQGATLQ